MSGLSGLLAAVILDPPLPQLVPSIFSLEFELPTMVVISTLLSTPLALQVVV